MAIAEELDADRRRGHCVARTERGTATNVVTIRSR